MEKKIDPIHIGDYAESLYREGGFTCGEAVISGLREKIGIDVPQEIIGMASGFAGGIGQSGCVCGAISGGAMAIGLLYGRSKPGEDASKAQRLTRELHDGMRLEMGKNVVCCRVLTRGMDRSKGEHKPQCGRFVNMSARQTAELILGETPTLRKESKNLTKVAEKVTLLAAATLENPQHASGSKGK